MKKIALAAVVFSLASILFSACQANHAAEPRVKGKSKKDSTSKKTTVKREEPPIGTILTENYVMNLHGVFVYFPKKSAGMANWKPKEGHRWIYLDVSLRNVSRKPLDGGAVFIALKIKDKNGVEYKKPAAALAAYHSDNPGVQDVKEYDGLWASFTPGEYHREVIYAVEVPENINEFTLSLPVDKLRKEWKQIDFSL